MSNQNVIKRIDWDAISDRIINNAVVGLNLEGRIMLGRARHYAPVRSIFARTRRGPEMGSRAMGHPFSDENMAAFKRSLPKNTQIRTRIFGQQRGHANSAVPVFRAGNERSTGDFRQYNPETRQLMPVTTAYQRGTGKIRTREGSGTAQLSERGRYEVAHAEARGILTVGPRVVVGTRQIQTARVGGHLRDDLMFEPGTNDGQDVIWASVRSETPYARPQEYGSRHNRAHPFLRPALYEARGRLLGGVSRAIGR